MCIYHEGLTTSEKNIGGTCTITVTSGLPLRRKRARRSGWTHRALGISRTTVYLSILPPSFAQAAPQAQAPPPRPDAMLCSALREL